MVNIKKYCKICKKYKPQEQFYKYSKSKDGLYYYCKSCVSIRNKNYRKNHMDKYREYQKTYRNKNPQKIRMMAKKYRIKNKDKYRMRILKWRNSSLNKLSTNIGKSIWRCIKGNKDGKHWEDLIGYNLEDLKNHLEKQFRDGMNWNNYGKHGWHIDHIRPISSFNFTSYEDEEFKECWSLDNLQPLWAKENQTKHAKYNLRSTNDN